MAIINVNTRYRCHENFSSSPSDLAPLARRCQTMSDVAEAKEKKNYYFNEWAIIAKIGP